ncbi:MAG: tyrosine-type recombinase/integrase [Pseudomonadota bacterium]
MYTYTPNLPVVRPQRPAWNKGRIVGQKRPLLPKHVWAIRVRLEIAENLRDLALFNTAIDSKLRGCDHDLLKVADVYLAGRVKERTSVLQSKTQKPVRFEITEGTRKSLRQWLDHPMMIGQEYLWPGRFHEPLHISTRQYARLVRDWVTSIGLEPSAYGTHSMRRTKVAQIYRKTGNLRAVQLLLGHTKMDSTVRYLGVELEDALAIAEAVEI